jgi:hypothetical protein
VLRLPRLLQQRQRQPQPNLHVLLPRLLQLLLLLKKLATVLKLKLELLGLP